MDMNKTKERLKILRDYEAGLESPVAEALKLYKAEMASQALTSLKCDIVSKVLERIPPRIQEAFKAHTQLEALEDLEGQIMPDSSLTPELLTEVINQKSRDIDTANEVFKLTVEDLAKQSLEDAISQKRSEAAKAYEAFDEL